MIVEFTVTEDHLKLIRAMYVDWQDMEFGAPAIDPKRPYGNSDVTGDIAEILGEPVPPDDDAAEEWFAANDDRLTALHRDTRTVLQIVLATGMFEPGIYTRRNPYLRGWIKSESRSNP